MEKYEIGVDSITLPGSELTCLLHDGEELSVSHEGGRTTIEISVPSHNVVYTKGYCEKLAHDAAAVERLMALI